MKQCPAKHEYPSEYGRGINAKLDHVWDILDTIRPGVIPNDVRFLLAGAMYALSTSAVVLPPKNSDAK
jgi:hypothetical protein